MWRFLRNLAASFLLLCASAQAWAVPWSFVNAGAVSTGSSLTLAVPASITTGDLLVIVVAYSNGSTVPATPAGWTPRYNTSSQRIAIFDKVATSSESSVSISTALGAGVMVAYRTITGLDVLGTINTTTSTNSTTNSLTTTAADDLVISIYENPSNTTSNWTGVPASTTSRVNQSSANGSHNGLLIVDEDQATASATTSRTAVQSQSLLTSSIAISYKSGTVAVNNNMLIMF